MGAPDQTPGLGDVDERRLAFERQWWKHQGAKEAAVRDAFDESLTTYCQRLNRLIDTEAAMAHDPLLVGRLRRLRDARAAARRPPAWVY